MKFCNNFSIIAEPLTNLLGKRSNAILTDNCHKSFEKLKAIFKCAPVLLAPSFDKEFRWPKMKMMLMQAVYCYKKMTMVTVDHPVRYYSKIVHKSKN